MYRYYMTKRPPAPGAAPRTPAQVWTYGANGVEFDRLGRVWGYVEYEQELTPQEVADYELTPGGTTPPYYPIHEDMARRAHEMMSFSDYRTGSKTEEYHRMVDEVFFVAHRQKGRVDAMYHEKIDRLAESYARKLADNFNDSSRIGCMCPSVMIAGPANFPVRKKEKQNAAADRNMAEYREIQGIPDRICSVGKGGISSDDPQALAKLKAKLEKLEKHQELMKAANAAIRMKDTTKGDAKLAEMGYTPEEIAELRKPDFCGRVGYPSFELSNNNANIRRIKERVAELEKRQTEPAPEGWKFDGGEVVLNTGENRLQIIFDDKPDADLRAELKGEGFRWAPSQGAWQRQLTDNAFRAVRRIKALTPLETAGDDTPAD